MLWTELKVQNKWRNIPVHVLKDILQRGQLPSSKGNLQITFQHSNWNLISEFVKSFIKMQRNKNNQGKVKEEQSWRSQILNFSSIAELFHCCIYFISVFHLAEINCCKAFQLLELNGPAPCYYRGLKSCLPENS